FVVPANDDYYLSVEHLHYWGGPEQTYRITITPYEPSFELSVGIDRYDVAQAGTVGIPILVARRDYSGPIEVSVIGAPGLVGRLVTLAGKPAQPNQPAGILLVSAAGTLPVNPMEFRIAGTATINGKSVTHLASAQSVV